MRFWEGGQAGTLLVLLVLLLACELAVRLLPPLRRLALPLAIVAGVLGLLLGEQVLGLFRLDTDLLEALVYHGLAVVFIAVGLQTPLRGGRTAGSRSMAFAIVAMMATQATLGLAVVLLLDASLHPGFGLMLPMGFEEGPGQALAMGEAWSRGGMEDGAQVGLIVAVMGYAWAVLAGVPLVIWGRAKGLGDRSATSAAATAAPAPQATAEAGGLDRLSLQLALVGLCYLLTYGVCSLAARLLAGMPDLAAMVWGFHFIIGAAVAMLVRPLLSRLPGQPAVDDTLMARLAGVSIDIVTCAALAAVQLAVLRAHWLPILLITSLGGVWTLLFGVWAGRRAWREAPFEHTVLWFGASTGTLPTGLALLKVADPELKSPAPVSAVFGSAGSILGVAPLLMGLVPLTVSGFGGDWPAHGWKMLGALLVYDLVVIGLWRAIGGLRFTRPLTSLWP